MGKGICCIKGLGDLDWDLGFGFTAEVSGVSC